MVNMGLSTYSLVTYLTSNGHLDQIPPTHPCEIVLPQELSIPVATINVVTM